jgi:hypothetical protein
MGNLCGKQAQVDLADGQPASSRQGSTVPGTRGASKSHSAVQPESSGASVKKQQSAAEQQQRKVQWSIPAEPAGQDEQAASPEAEQQSTVTAATASAAVQP